MMISFTYSCKYSNSFGFINPGLVFVPQKPFSDIRPLYTIFVTFFKKVLFYSNSRCTFVMQSDEDIDCKSLFENTDLFTAAGRAGFRRPWCIVLLPPFQLSNHDTGITQTLCKWLSYFLRLEVAGLVRLSGVALGLGLQSFPGRWRCELLRLSMFNPLNF